MDALSILGTAGSVATGGVLGGLLRLIPEITGIFRGKLEQSHEERMLELNYKVDVARAAIEGERLRVQGDINYDKQQLESIIAAQADQMKQSTSTGIRFVDYLLGIADAMSKFVRPILTYWYCILAYGSYKVALYTTLVSQNAPWESAVIQLWTPFDQSVMYSIIAFWFMDRALKHARS
jgi:hypothetical protein